MSRTGNKPIPLPDSVTLQVKQSVVEVKGPKGTLSQEITCGITVVVDKDKKEVRVERPGDTANERALHGLYRSLVANMIHGVVTPFVKKLEIHGVGYNAKVQGKLFTLNIGFCHPVEFNIADDLDIECPRPTQIVISGANKQKVGQLAAEIRHVRPPEPYNEKGIRYEGEIIRKKAGKTFVSGAS